MCDLQSEAFLRQAVEQVLEEVKARLQAMLKFKATWCLVPCTWGRHGRTWGPLVEAECPPSNALHLVRHARVAVRVVAGMVCMCVCPVASVIRQKLQNLSHQLRVLHGDAELIRSASQAVQTLAELERPYESCATAPNQQLLHRLFCPRQGTRRRTKSIAPSAHMRRASAFDARTSFLFFFFWLLLLLLLLLLLF